MIYGYARVSTQGQAHDGNSLEAQEKTLRENGATEVYTDTYTGVEIDRPELNKLLDILNPGDTIVVTKLDRIARNLKDGITLIDNLNENGIKLYILNMGVIDDSSTGTLIRNIMLAFAQYERDLIEARMREGKEIARNRPGYREGRKPVYSHAQFDHAMELLETHTYSQVVAMTGISKATLAREKAKRKNSPNE